MTEPSPFGLLLRSLRVGQNLTLEALASRSGVSVRTIGDLERGAVSYTHLTLPTNREV